MRVSRRPFPLSKNTGWFFSPSVEEKLVGTYFSPLLRKLVLDFVSMNSGRNSGRIVGSYWNWEEGSSRESIFRYRPPARQSEPFRLNEMLETVREALQSPKWHYCGCFTIAGRNNWIKSLLKQRSLSVFLRMRAFFPLFVFRVCV